MLGDHAHEVTRILNEWRSGDESAAERLFPLVYDELRLRARQYLKSERSDHTLQPTALVHEAYLRLAAGKAVGAENRIHFYAIAARVMRQILVDHARAHNAEKRGGAAQRLSVEDLTISGGFAGDILELDDALRKLEAIDERKRQVVDMRFFGGLSEREIAEALGVHEKTVRRDWQFAKLWLYRELTLNHG